MLLASKFLFFKYFPKEVPLSICRENGLICCFLDPLSFLFFLVFFFSFLHLGVHRILHYLFPIIFLLWQKEKGNIVKHTVKNPLKLYCIVGTALTPSSKSLRKGPFVSIMVLTSGKPEKAQVWLRRML